MKSRALVPARIEWADDGTAQAPAFGDRYHPRVGAAAQARHVFLGGNGLPERWRGRSDFTIAETGFGLGHNFLTTWKAWRDDAQRPARLHFVSIEAHPLRLDDLRQALAGCESADLAQQLLAAWPPLVPGLHRIGFEGGAVQLLLAFGDVHDLLPELVFAADAFYLDGFAPARNPAMWDRHVIKALARRARPGATAATWSVARELRHSLSACGFDWQLVQGIGGKRENLQARFAPRFSTPFTAAAQPASPTADERRAIVIGAGLAGACTAAALAAQGFEVQVLDRHAAPAQGSSGNPAGLFHATVHADDGPYARLFRAAALHTARLLERLDPDRVPRSVQGLLRLEHQLSIDAMQGALARQGLPPDFVQAVDAAEASRRSGLPLAAPAWFYPLAGWVSPADLVRDRLAQAGVQFRGQTAVHALQRHGSSWACVDAAGRTIATAAHVLLASAEQINPLLASIAAPAFPLSRSRGQVSLFRPEPGVPAPDLPIAGDGYVLGLPDGRVLCGATTSDSDDEHPSDDEHSANFDRLQRLCGLRAPADPSRWQGRVGWRVQTADRLPITGPLAALQFGAGQRLDQARLIPREPGLHLASAFGARGITLAPLLAELVAARIAGTPLPLEQSLVDAVDPARWIVRAARQNR